MKLAVETVRIRPMAAKDIPMVRAIDRMSFALPWPESSYYYELESNRTSHLLVAEEQADAGTTIVGYIGFWLIADEAHISTIAVHPDWRRRGLGKRLLRRALANAAQAGAQMATLEVRPSNQAAIEMYAAFGFVEVGRRRRYYRDNMEDALMMTLPEIAPNSDSPTGSLAG